jgi:hypothetical protein
MFWMNENTNEWAFYAIVHLHDNSAQYSYNQFIAHLLKAHVLKTHLYQATQHLPRNLP